MNDDTDLDSDAQTYNDDAYLGAAHYAAPQTVAWTHLVADGGSMPIDANMTRRGVMIGIGAAVATAATGGVASAQAT